MAKDPHRLEPAIRSVLDATNNGDGKAFAAAFTKDAAINDWGEVHAGRREISAWDAEHNTGARVRVEVTGVSRVGGEVLVLLRLTKGKSDETETATWAFRLQGGAVAGLEIG